jgi:hypothetical protein
MDRFEELLKQVGAQLDIALHLDPNRACNLNINGLFHIQIEEDVRKDALLLASFICEVPPGKFRENVLREALKSNNAYPRVGTLGYSDRNNQLALFTHISWYQLTADKFLKSFNPFLEKVDNWRLAITSGHPAPENRERKGAQTTAPNIFGLQK